MNRYVGAKISKFFDPPGRSFPGVVTSVRYDDDEDDGEPLFWIDYEDDDEEELNLAELQDVLLVDDHPATMHEEEKKMDDDDYVRPTKSASGRPLRRAAVRPVSYVDEDDFTEDDEDERVVVQKKRSRGVVKTTAGRKKARVARSKANGDDDDESDYEMENIFSSEDEELDLQEYDAGSDSGEDSPDEDKPAASKARNKKATKSKAAVNANAPPKKSMAESFRPASTPLFHKLSLEEIQKTKGYLDPCGMEATDDIISRLVGEQVDKIGTLLQRSITKDESATFPLRLATACSGTDAPALALTLVKEQMEQRGLSADPSNNSSKSDAVPEFKFDHVFSCENDPFKQAYLARNFDSILYPDIAKLTGGDHDYTPRDAYGRARPLPSSNLFVAGTSCKNFSMLRSRHRLDIEDKGCSGETFLAATEVLFQEQPKFAIFENVDKAPWGKMSEYITGRVKLSECGEDKFIKNATATEKKKVLTFVNEGGRLVVHDVPPVYGIRCGAVVAGYLTPKSGEELIAIDAPGKPKSKSGTYSLTAIMEKNGIKKATDTLVFETPCVYCTRHVRVDTKFYGLPQTRQRVYMFVWKPEDGDANDDLGEYWEMIVKFLQSPVKNSLEGFILEDDHEIIRTFREALAGPLGRATRRGVFLQPDFWTSRSANLPHNKIAREKSGLNDMARSLTQWNAYGAKQIPPHYWKEYIDLQQQREVDALEILHGTAARDAECHDSSFSSFFWNISQNVSKEKHRTAVPGIAGCITPGGDFFLPHKGRPLLGCEKLLLQGIPYFRLALGNETEVQLGDLAGNAMSLTVVCATMLAAITCEQLRREAVNRGETPEHVLAKAGCRPGMSDEDSRLRAVVPDSDISLKEDAMPIFNELAALAQEAIEASVWCTCETSGRNSLSADYLECKVCRVSCCRNCVSSTSGYQMDSHDTTEKHISVKDHFHGHFSNKLRDVCPNSLVFNQEGFQVLAGIENDQYRFGPLSNAVFKLNRIKRERRKWRVLYYARSVVASGLGDKIAEFAITIGEVRRQMSSSTEIVECGMVGELRSFLPARMQPLVPGIIEPCAFIKVRLGVKQQAQWKAKMRTFATPLIIAGRDMSSSFRVEVGLNDESAKQLLQNATSKIKKQDFNASKQRNEERRWIYAKQWKNWPTVIDIRGTDSTDSTLVAELYGSYRRARCRQTTNQSGLWIREGTDEKPALYILIKPNVQRLGPDVGVISSSISTADTTSIKATLPAAWQPCDSLVPELQMVSVEVVEWSRFPQNTMQCHVPPSTLTVTSQSQSNTELTTVRGFTEDDMQMLHRSIVEVKDSNIVLEMTGGQIAQQRVRVFNALCVSPILQHAASSRMFEAWRNWVVLEKPVGVPFGCCTKIVPDRPEEEWFFDDERGEWDRRSQEGASKKYYTALNRAEQAFTFILDRHGKSLSVHVHPEVAAHHAAHGLIWRRGGNIRNEVLVQYRLSQSLFEKDPILKEFKVWNCDSECPTMVSLKQPFELYERQKKAVTKMLNIEKRKTAFEELEMSEHDMPGTTGWNIIARATRRTKLAGGVIADAIGAGKTVVSIALILHGVQEARTLNKPENGTSASLVVVPPGLIDQWCNEIGKFTDKLNVLTIYDRTTLQSISVKEILEADVVIAPIDILEAKGYMGNLIAMSNGKEMDHSVPVLPSFVGQQECIDAKGIWIPANSADPYGGAKNFRSQRRRNQSAYFTHTYLGSIQKLREKTFNKKTKGVPLEYFQWERVIVDEIHESLCTRKSEIEGEMAKYFRERNRRAGRELLGITERDNSRRPLVFRKAIYGLSGTPLLDSTNRVIELASLMGNAYIIGLSSHWRRLERESARDIFLESFLATKQSREIRKNIYAKCQEYLDRAAMRNKSGDEMNGIELIEHRKIITLTEREGELYKDSQSGIDKRLRTYSIKPEEFDPSSGHDISKFLRQNASFNSRGKALVEICKEILSKNKKTKIIVFADGRIGAGKAAVEALNAEDDLGCTWIDTVEDSVEEQNRKIGYYQRADSTREDRERPRVLVLHFEHAAGLNLQTECNNVIMFAPLYVGDGGTTSDPVSDASTELQAIGRVFRPGQLKPTVSLYRIEAQGPNHEELLDGQLIRRNTDKENVQMATNSAD